MSKPPNPLRSSTPDRLNAPEEGCRLAPVHSILNASQELFAINLRFRTLVGLDALEVAFLYKGLNFLIVLLTQASSK
jgi:hypothetical protein